jgi:hypothetical protein
VELPDIELISDRQQSEDHTHARHHRRQEVGEGAVVTAAKASVEIKTQKKPKTKGERDGKARAKET